MSDQLFCHLRKKWVVQTPEELVRQQFIRFLIQEAGYPLHSFVLEKSLNSLPHLQHGPYSLPKRRADLLCFVKDIHPSYPLYPLLMVECKAVQLNQKVLRQIIGYNFYVQAYFIAAVNQNECLFGRYDPIKHDLIIQPTFLSYQNLLHTIHPLHAHLHKIQ